MSRRSYLLSVCFLLGIITIIIETTIPKSNSYSINRLSVISSSPKQLPIAKIIIPKIKLDGNLYNKESNVNNVDENIKILKESIFPNNDNSIVFLAAHSGNASNAYFNELDKLNIGDYVILQYKGYNYFYVVDKIFEEEKDGDIEVLRTSNNQLVLTTCSKTSMKKQLIVNSNLRKKEEIT